MRLFVRLSMRRATVPSMVLGLGLATLLGSASEWVGWSASSGSQTSPRSSRSAMVPASVSAVATGPLEGPQVEDPQFERVIRPLIARYCVSCHGEERQRGDVRLDRLDPDLTNGPDRELFELALELIEDEEMPSSKAELQPTDVERQTLVDWIRRALIQADEGGGRNPLLRRLSRDQYGNALQDLLGMRADFARRLPPDARSESGFSGDAEALGTSALQLEAFRSIAREALDQAIVTGDRPEPFRVAVELGRGQGASEGNAQTGGYQSVPLPADDFRVRFLDREGEVLDAPRSRRRAVTVGLRGSGLDRFHTVDDGVVLYSALPHREVAPMAWQGPSPNLKLEMQRIVPQRGEFVLRVDASRGVLADGGREVLLAPASLEPEPLVALTDPEELGAAAFEPTGFGDWHIAGPIATDSGAAAQRTRYVPEGPLDFEQPLLVPGGGDPAAWTRAPGLDGRIRRYPEVVGAVLLGRVIDAPSARVCELSIGSDDAVFIWLNREPVLEADVRRGVAADQDRVLLPLREGRNDLLVKVINHGGGFGSFVSTVDDGTVRTPPAVGLARADGARSPIVGGESDGHIVIDVDRIESMSNLRVDRGVLRPEKLPEDADLSFRRFVPGGLWQFDLVHPIPEDAAMASIGLSIDQMKLDMRPEAREGLNGLQVTTVGVGRLHEGLHRFRIGGPFFVGFSQLVMTRLDPAHPVAERLERQAAAETEGLVPELKAFIGTRTDDGMDYRSFDGFRRVEGAVGEFERYEFRGRLEDLPIPEPDSGDRTELSGICVVGVWNHHLVKSADQSGPPLLVHRLEFETPVFDQWPPVSHQQILRGLDDSEPRHRADAEARMEQILAAFLPRAFRRPVADDEVARALGFFRRELARVLGDEDQNEPVPLDLFFDCVRETLAAVLCQPSFLYLVEREDGNDPDRIDPYALANRLSFFLWDGPPDQRLIDLAREGRLREELHTEVDRLLDDPRSERFVRRFTAEWLRMDRFRGVTIDPNLFPAFSRFVVEDMAEEPWRFVALCLREDRDLAELIDSDTAMLNQNLAEFYGIDGVSGSEFRPVELPREKGRGGLLSHGAFLAGHSDGQEPHPIKRAVFVKERLLGQRPLPPPPNVPDLDPTIEGFDEMTLKERIQQHRDNPSCMECHASFDPYGIALESYDAVGILRKVRKGRPVDTSTVLPDGTEVDGVFQLKDYIGTEAFDRFTGALTGFLFGYALGREPGPLDRIEIDSITEACLAERAGLRGLIHLLVGSESFAERF